MKLRKAIKKIVALGTGTSMIGATLLGASAADLSNYPAPFITDGMFNGKIVVGAQAAAQDVIGSIEIATSLQTESVTQAQVSTGGTAATTTLIGDSFKVEKSSDKLNFQEYLSDPVEVITASDLDALEGGSVTNEKGTYQYDQFIILKESSLKGNNTNASVEYTIDSDQSDDPASYLWFKDGYRVYTYRLSFPTALKSDIDSNGDFDDLDNKKIMLLGKEYTIINTDNATGVLELMGGAIQDTLQEYEKKTYNLNGVEYEVEVVAISSLSEVILKVNGEVTEKKSESETVKLSDGTEIGIKTILENEGTETGGGDLVTFYLGASKVKLTDSTWSEGNTDGTLDVGTDTVNNVYIDIVGSGGPAGSATTASISKIEVVWTANDDFYVPIGGKLSEQLPSDEKDKLFLQNLDFQFAALQQGTTTEVKVQNSGSDKYKVTFDTKSGGTISDTFFYVSAENSNDGNISLGKSSSYPFQTTAATALNKNHRFSVTNNKFSHYLQVGAFYNSSDKVQIKDLGTGESFDVSVVSHTGTMYLDGYAYPFTANLAPAAETITFASYGDDGGGVFWTPEEYKLKFSSVAKLSGNNTPGITMGQFDVQEYKQESGDTTTETRNWINTTIIDEGSSTKTTIGAVSSDSSLQYGTGTWTTQSWDSKDDWATAFTKYGTFVEHDTDGTQDAVTIYPGDEVFAEAFVISGTVSVSSAGGAEEGTVTTTIVNPIDVGSAILDTEVSDVTSDNYMSIGGPCANSASARMLGVAQKIPECLSGLSMSEGEGVIKLFENGDKVSMIVAGATALDTQRASRVLANYGDYALSGMEVSVTGTSLSDITVSAPAVEEVVEEEAEE